VATADDVVAQFLAAGIAPAQLDPQIRNAIDSGDIDTAEQLTDLRSKSAREIERAENADAKADQTLRDQAEQQARLMRDRVTGAVDRVASVTNPARDFMARQPTPGGVGMLVFVLIFLSFALIPVSPQGRTRLMLLWSMLTGRTQCRDGEICAAS
jgi:hypothetical protein